MLDWTSIKQLQMYRKQTVKNACKDYFIEFDIIISFFSINCTRVKTMYD